MIRHKNATFIVGEWRDVYECEECGNRQLVYQEEDKEQCNLCGHNNHKEYLKFLDEQARAGML
jgi:rubrerythrin